MFNEKLRKQLRVHEGVKRFPYLDTVGKTTVGVGRNLTDVGLSEDEIDYLLDNDINRVLMQAKQLEYWDRLTESRKLVIADMIFNMGWPVFMTFKKTQQAIANGQYLDASRMMMESKWAKQVGKRAVTLSDMMARG